MSEYIPYILLAIATVILAFTVGVLIATNKIKKELEDLDL